MTDVAPDVAVGLAVVPGVFSVETVVRHNGQIDHGHDRVLLAIPSGHAWNYAASFPKLRDVASDPSGFLVRIRAHLLSGAVAIGAIQSDMTHFIAEKLVANAGRVAVDLVVRDLGDCAGIMVRAAGDAAGANIEIHSIDVYRGYESSRVSNPSYRLHDITTRPFAPRAVREKPFAFGSFATTEVCNLSCVMCHFNGPNAVKKAETLSPEYVRKALREIPSGQEVWFAATGEFFIDPHALDHVSYASSLGLKPCVLSHGQLYTHELIDAVIDAGVRMFRISCDSVDPHQYAKIRRGGTLQNILDAVSYLRSKKSDLSDLRVEINCTIFASTMRKRDEMIRFWQGKVDQVNFNAEYYDIFRFRNIFFQPQERDDCRIQTYVLPSGKIAPCCAVMVYAHDHDVSWLPDIRSHTLQQAYDALCDMYEDAESPLGKLCANCDWWIMYSREQVGQTPYLQQVPLDVVPAAATSGCDKAQGKSLWRRLIGQ